MWLDCIRSVGRFVLVASISTATQSSMLSVMGDIFALESQTWARLVNMTRGLRLHTRLRFFWLIETGAERAAKRMKLVASS